MTRPHLGHVLVSDTEWRAILEGARALRGFAIELRKVGAESLATERERAAVVLDGVIQRAIVLPARSAERDAEVER